MTIAAGARIGTYEVVAPLGAGGMGEVYRARDARLSREVAIKILPAAFSSNSGRRERLEREARVLASLNHPNIATLHGIEDSPWGLALVMELVDGATLADRLAREGTRRRGLPVHEALLIAQQVAAGLEAAHSRGIIHRDLKPSNIAVRRDGVVKVLDFGLAKTDALADGVADAAHTATQTLDAPGVVLGTPAYASPEQARGLPADRRTDVWAFGCVLYELLTGRRPFAGATVPDVVASVLESEPDLDALPGDVPATVRRLIQRCLQKDARNRLRDVGDAGLEISDALAGRFDPPPTTPRRVATFRMSLLPWAVATLGIGLAALGFIHRRDAGAPPPLVRFQIPIPGGLGTRTTFALSPDGRRLAISSPENGQLRLRVRSLDALDAPLLPGGEGAQYPFWKPDGTEIGFFADGKLKTVSLSGGSPAIIANVDPTVLGAAWSPQEVIVLSQGRELYTVSAKGGNPTLLYRGPGIPYSPVFLPDGRHFLYWEDGCAVGALDGSPPVKLPIPGLQTAYSDGFLVYRHRTQIMAQRFDAGALKVKGDAVPLISEDVMTEPLSDPFSVVVGVLAYQQSSLEQLVWKDRSGGVAGKIGEPQPWPNFRLSPDQSKIAWDFPLGGVAIFDVVRGTRERLITKAAMVPVFSPDAAQIAVTSARTGRFNPYVASAVNQERMVADVGTTGGYPLDWSPDGRNLLYWGDEDLWIVPVDGTSRPYKYAPTAFEERAGSFSPDGKWIAYASNESGQYEVYLKPFPEAGGRRYAVSNRGGSSPAWRRDGRELFYVSGDGLLTAVPITTRDGAVEFGRAEKLFAVPPSNFNRAYDVSPDGKRILVAASANTTAAITVLLNWRQALDRR